jgi:glycosyltransferase involved in cell wall biosynthesis
MYHQLKGLSANHQVHLISLSHDLISPSSQEHISEFCESITLLPISKAVSIMHAALGVFNNLPFQVNYFFSKSRKRVIKEKISEIQPDIIYCQLIRMSEYVQELPYPKVLDFMDAFSLNYKRRVEFEKPLSRTFFRVESKRLSDYEVKMYEQFDASIIIADQDREAIAAGKEIQKVTNGLNVDYFSPQERIKTFDIVFVGNMGYHPNILAAGYLVEKILPLCALKPSVQIAGARPSKRVSELASSRVGVTGWVDDIRDAYGSAKIFVAPIFSGAGQQNKIMEAMAMEMICITTPIVNEGIKAKVGEEILIARNEAEFANLIDDVLKNIDRYKNIGVNARKFVKANFSWQKENKKLEEILLKEAKRKTNGI